MSDARIDPITLAVMANRFEAIVREMTHVVVRSARSGIINTARDLSCSIITADGELLAIGDAIPMHVAGGKFQARALRELQPDLREGDAFLHNDPYNGGLHAADHTLLVPVFHEGRHLFTVSCVAHQADCGNSIPTTYMGTARDVYEEGALIFPCVRVQSEYEPIPDVLRMCRARIRASEQWYGDHLAQVGATRVGERRIKQLFDKHGADTVEAFAREWLDYSERRMMAAIGRLPSGTHHSTGRYGPVRGLDAEILLRFRVVIDGEGQTIDVDLRDNPDCVPAGVNTTESTAYASAVIGVLNALPEDVPVNEGSLRRIRVHLRENCVAGIPRFPASCSAGTTEVSQRVINGLQLAFAEAGDGYGLAAGASGHPAANAVLSGADDRHGGRPFVNEVSIAPAGGGPGGPSQDGSVTYSTPSTAGVMYPAGVELTELKQPIYVEEVRIRADSGGPGRRRGGAGCRVSFRPVSGRVRAIFNLEHESAPPQGVLGGLPGEPMRAWIRSADGTMTQVPAGPQDIEVEPDQVLITDTPGGGGYGPPRERDADRVRADAEEGWISLTAARTVYGLVDVADGVTANA